MANKTAAAESRGGKQKGTVRQRKKSGQHPSSSTTTAHDNDKTNDEDRLLQEAIQSAGAAKSINCIPILLAGLFVAAIVALASPFGSNSSNPSKDNSHQQQQEGSSSIADDEAKQQRRAQEESISTMPVTNVVTDFKIVRTLPHDTKAFTQGLTFRPDNSSILYEATGMYKESELRVLNLDNGDILQRYEMPGQYFGEGLSYIPAGSSQQRDNGAKEQNDKNRNSDDNDGRLIHITWREQTGFIFNVNTLEVLEEFSYDKSLTTNEGWGIIHVPPSQFDDELDNNTKFIVSDGSAYLHFWNGQYQETKEKLEVTFRTDEMAAKGVPPQPMKHLNELEWDERTQTVLANVWYQDMIARIDPKTGFMTTIYDLRSLYTDRHPEADSFNGIALSAEGDLWVTGKYWPHLYQIELGGS